MIGTMVSRLTAILTVGLFLAGCASNELKPQDQSGYLDSYSDLNEAKDSAGNTLYKFVNPDFNPKNYAAVLIDPVVFYPKAKPSEQLTEETLARLRDYTNQTLRRALEAKVEVVDKPGPGIARIQIAFTSVAPAKEGLKAYQYVPIALVVTSVKRGVAGAPEQPRIAVEGKISDSVSGNRLYKVVRIGTGDTLEQVDGQSNVITLESVKPLIDDWIKTGSEGMTNYIKAK